MCTWIVLAPTDKCDIPFSNVCRRIDGSSTPDDVVPAWRTGSYYPQGEAESWFVVSESWQYPRKAKRRATPRKTKISGNRMTGGSGRTAVSLDCDSLTFGQLRISAATNASQQARRRASPRLVSSSGVEGTQEKQWKKGWSAHLTFTEEEDGLTQKSHGKWRGEMHEF